MHVNENIISKQAFSSIVVNVNRKGDEDGTKAMYVYNRYVIHGDCEYRDR